jgi:hypothetical protein
MYRILFLLLAFILINTQPFYAQAQSVQIKNNLTFFSKGFLGVKNGLRYSNKAITKLDLGFNKENSSAQLAFNYDKNDNFTLDRSYLQYTSGIATFGIGAIDRNWSFSENTSLILSHNARPSKSIYLKFKNEFKNDWLPSKATWDLNLFNAFTEGSLNGSESMLLGIRTILSPIDGLDFELVQTSQWGGSEYNNGITALAAALLFDTNNGLNANINKMAGFGISYKIPRKILPLRIYGQLIGEDEAGSLPSCYNYLAGLEWEHTKTKYPSILGIEAIDTRMDTTEYGFCSPNTTYNNGTYSYTNYGKTMGAEIDTEGTSISLFVQSQISHNIKVEFEAKSVVINDSNWSGHRLSSDRQSGFISSLGLSWIKNNIKFNGDIYSQDFNLNKAKIKNGYGISFSSSIVF